MVRWSKPWIAILRPSSVPLEREVEDPDHRPSPSLVSYPYLSVCTANHLSTISITGAFWAKFYGHNLFQTKVRSLQHLLLIPGIPRLPIHVERRGSSLQYHHHSSHHCPTLPLEDRFLSYKQAC
jgi:hypothetical protein